MNCIWVTDSVERRAYWEWLKGKCEKWWRGRAARPRNSPGPAVIYQACLCSPVSRSTADVLSAVNAALEAAIRMATSRPLGRKRWSRRFRA